MHHIFDIEDIVSLHNLVWNELKKAGIKETGRWRKPTRNNENIKKVLFGQPLELLECEPALILIETEIENDSEDLQPIYVKGDILMQIPVFIVQCCQAILKGVTTEGLFRKAGSSSRQKEIKRQLERGEGVKPSHDVIDLANILKQFLRELPEPLIPYQLHEVLLKCLQLEEPDRVIQALHMTCLLIPPVSLATLCYLLQFFEAVAMNSSANLMDSLNLSIVMAPTLMPIHIAVPSRNDRQNCSRLHSYAKIIQMLILNNSRICGIPYYISNKLHSLSSPSLLEHDRGRSHSRDKKRHRRSSSFNRVFEGLRKMVGVKSDSASLPEQPSKTVEIPVEISTSPRPNMKRKVDTESHHGFSVKKKKAVTDLLPQGKVLCNTPLTPQGHHVTQSGENHHLYNFASPRIELNPSPTQISESKSGVLRFFHRKKFPGRIEEPTTLLKTPKFPKRRLSLGRKSVKKSKREPDETTSSISTANEGIADTCEYTSQESTQGSVPDLPTAMVSIESIESVHQDPVEETYEEVKFQYEELKSHVDALEKELAEKNPTPSANDQAIEVTTPVSTMVQDVYEKTLEEAEKISLNQSESDQLARQLSRGLRIRRSAEQRVIRSPSARKIGAIRRRSRESPRSSLNGNVGSPRRLTRSQSLVLSRNGAAQQRLQTPEKQPALLSNPLNSNQCIRSALRRGKPNTVRSGLRDPTPLRGRPSIHEQPDPETQGDQTPRSSKSCRPTRNQTGNISEPSKTKKPAINRKGSVLKIAQTFDSITTITTGDEIAEEKTTCVDATPEVCQWTSAELLARQFEHLRVPLTGRPSVQKIRSENVGKVSACVRKFDGLASPAAPTPDIITAPSVARKSRTPKSSPAEPEAHLELAISGKICTPVNTSVPRVSPLRESQRANALPLNYSRINDRSNLKIKAPLVTPSRRLDTPHSLKLRPHEIRVQKKSSPLKATVPLRRSPRFTPASQ